MPDTIQLSDLDGSSGSALNGITFDAFSGEAVSFAGDINGDGFDDIVIGAYFADINGTSSGRAFVVFGTGEGFGASFNLSNLDGDNGFIIDGVSAFDELGRAVSSAGDINGDGFDDILVSAANSQTDGAFSGRAYVLFGSDSGFSPSFNLSNLNGDNGFTIIGINDLDAIGWSVSNAGDVNDDGVDDIIIGTLGGDTPNGDTGAAYVIFGNESGFGATVSLGSLNGSNGFAIYGVNNGDFAGTAVSSAGDVNGDGVDDLIIGAQTADPGGRDGAGEAYVVFGSASGFSSSFNLSSLNGSNGFTIIGEAAGDQAGYSVSGVGDINGDGFDDLVIGANSADTGGNSNSGAVYIVFGSDQDFGATIDLGDLNGSNGFKLEGINSSDFVGQRVAAAGDVNGDGYDDVIFSATGADPNGSLSGQSYLLFGSPDGFDAVINLADLDDIGGITFNGGNIFDISGADVAGAGDVNGDGYDDLLIGARRADGEQEDSGVTYVIYGNAAFGNEGVTLMGTSGADALTGAELFDSLSGGDGEDTLIGLAGNDTLSGGRGSDTLDGGEGNDVLFGGTQADRLDGGAGNDSLLGGNGNDTVEGGSGSDTLSGSIGDDSLNGGSQGDRLFGDSGADTLNGGGGSDRVDYLIGDDAILVDLETGEATGGFADGDVLISIESLFGGKGDDTLRALEAGSRLNGAGGDDIVTGRSGDDLLAGGNGNDVVTGGAGNDLMNGNRGDDTLDGGAGDDTLRGSAGADTFIFSEGTGDDIVLDFRANDLLDLSNTTTDFTTLADVQAAATETEAGLLIDLGGGDSVLLSGASITSLTDDNLAL